jgi:hypothetical protein
VKGVLSSRHSVLNNLPGTQTFCPLVRRTAALDRYIGKQLQARAREVLGRTHPDIATRAAAFLLLSDSRASFNIEGEQPSQDRALRWAQTIGEAGTLQLNTETLEGLQEKVISDWRFVIPGLRHRGGFIGIHDRVTRLPIPSHISARFLHQNGGLLSKRARAKEFQKLRDEEIERIELVARSPRLPQCLTLQRLLRFDVALRCCVGSKRCGEACDRDPANLFKCGLWAEQSDCHHTTPPLGRGGCLSAATSVRCSVSANASGWKT